MTSAAQAGRRFQFLQEIASGGFGCVYLAKLITADGDAQVVAVKLLHRRWTDNIEISSRMRDEARLLSRLHHQHIVEVLDFALIEGRSAVVMEYLDAVDTRVIIDHCRESGVRLPLAAALEICAAVASALDAAYNDVPSAGRGPGPVTGRPLRVIHRDVKPSNLMVDGRGGVKVLDFGIARAEFDAREAKTAELAFGSLEYMPPERLFFEPESAASDVYSLGTAFYELLALDKLGKAKLRQSEQEKFLGERLADLTERYVFSEVDTPGVEVELLELLKSMLAFDESNRPTAADVAVRMAGLAARAGSPTLAEWAHKEVPALIEVNRTSKQGSGTLVGQTVTEDPPAPPRDRLGDSPGDQSPDTDLFPMDEPSENTGDDSTARDDTRWMELKRAALASLSETSEVGPAVVQDLRLLDPVRPGVRTIPPAAEPSAPTHDSAASPRGSASLRLPRVFKTAKPARPQASEPVSDALGITLAMTRPDNVTPTSAPEPRAASSQPGRENRPRSLLVEEDLEGAPTVRFQSDEAGERQPESWSQPDSQPMVRTPSGLVPSEVDTVFVSASASERQLLSATSPRRPAHRSIVPPAPVPVDDSASAPLAYAISAVLLMVTSALVLLTVLFVGAIGIAALTLPSAPQAAAPLVGPAPGIEASQPSGSGALFVSALTGTRRMMVRCGEAESVGSDRVVVPGVQFAECTVTAVDGARQRRTAVVRPVEPRSYRCFEGTESTCR